MSPEVDRPWPAPRLNCLLTPSYDSMEMVTDFARFLNGAGGYVEQSTAYLDHHSASAYLAICHNSPSVASLRSSMPLAEMAKRSLTASGQVPLQIIALGAGNSVVETHLMPSPVLAGKETEQK